MIPVIIHNLPIQQMSSFKYLEVLVDSEGKYTITRDVTSGDTNLATRAM